MTDKLKKYSALFTFIFFLPFCGVSCTDVGNRDNINDYDGENYAYGDDLYYLNRDGKGFDGEIRVNSETGSFYIYDNGWRNATQLEINTYDYGQKNRPWDDANDGDSRWGSVDTGFCYVFEENVWRSGNVTDCSLGLGGCTDFRQELLVQGSDGTWYSCDAKMWHVVAAIELDTATWGAGNFDGEIRVGNINKTIYYIYETNEKAWRKALLVERNTYDYMSNKPWKAGDEGDSKWGSVDSGNCFVFANTNWRAGYATDCSLELRGCTEKRQGEFGVGNNGVRYQCDMGRWCRESDLDLSLINESSSSTSVPKSSSNFSSDYGTCVPDAPTTVVGSFVNWSFIWASGVTAATKLSASYRWELSGGDPAEGKGRSVSTYYSTPGKKVAIVTISSDFGVQTADCSVYVSE